MKQQNLKNIITGQDMVPGEMEYSWQEFVINRQERIGRKTDSVESLNKIEELLKKIRDDIASSLMKAIIARECKVTYIHYNRGFLDGLKLPLKLEKCDLD